MNCGSATNGMLILKCTPFSPEKENKDQQATEFRFDDL